MMDWISILGPICLIAIIILVFSGGSEDLAELASVAARGLVIALLIMGILLLTGIIAR